MKVSAVVLTGFLGAGKTTLLNRAMAVRAASTTPNEGKLGIIVNELGAIGVDGDLLPKGATRQVELPGGCVCCVLNDDLDRTVREMLEAAPEIDTLIIETTGVAEPLPIVWALEEDAMKERLRVAAVVTVVDPTSFATARAASVTAEVQVESADVVMLSKSDVATEDEMKQVRAEVERLAGKAPMVEGSVEERARWLLGLLADPEDRRLGETAAHAHVHVHAHAHVNHEHHGIDSVAFVVEEMVDLEELEDALAELPGEYVRVKGILWAVDPRTGSDVPGWVAVHRVGSRVSSEVVAEPEGGGRLVALGPGVTEAPLRAGLARAVVSSASSE
jgi:G3E family GTPase